MYFSFLVLHSLLRWLVIISLFYTLFRAYRGWWQAHAFTATDELLRRVTLAVSHTQALIGLILYFISPLTVHFMTHFKEAVHDRQLRFFGMEHSFTMLLAVVIITITAMRVKRQTVDKQKFKTLAIGFSIATLLIIIAIPWQFSPLVSRPLFRFFGF